MITHLGRGETRGGQFFHVHFVLVIVEGRATKFCMVTDRWEEVFRGLTVATLDVGVPGASVHGIALSLSEIYAVMKKHSEATQTLHAGYEYEELVSL